MIWKMLREVYDERECASVKIRRIGCIGDRVEVLPRSVEGDLDGGRNVSFSSLHLDEVLGNMKIMIGS